MEVIVVGTAIGRLLQHIRGADEQLWIRLVRDGVREELRLHAGRAEDPLHWRVVVAQQHAEEGPVARDVEVAQQRARGGGRRVDVVDQWARITGDAEAVVGVEAGAVGRAALVVERVVDDVGVASAAVAVVARVAAAVRKREVADAHGSRAGVRARDLGSGAREHGDERDGAKARLLAGARAHVAWAAVVERLTAAENAPVGRRAEGDDAARRELLAQAARRADGEQERGEECASHRIGVANCAQTRQKGGAHWSCVEVPSA